MDTKYIKQVEELSKKLHSYIEVGVRQTDYNIYVYISGLNETDGSLLRSLSGYGLTYAEACEDYINELKMARCLMHNRTMVIM